MVFLTTAGALRLLSRQDAHYVRSHNMDTLKVILVTAEPLEVDVWKWTYSVVGTGTTPMIDSIPDKLTGRVPVVNMYIQSELGTFVTGNLINYTFPPLKPASVGPSMPGFNVDVVDDEGRSVKDSIGTLVVKNPWPAVPVEYPRDYQVLWSKGFYSTEDYAVMDRDLYIYVLGRSDTVMKVKGYRLSPGAMEEVIERALNRRAIVLGLYDKIKFESPLVLVESQVNVDDVRRVLREQIEPIVKSQTSSYGRQDT